MSKTIKKIITSSLSIIIIFTILLSFVIIVKAGDTPSLELQVPILGFDKAENFAEYMAKIFSALLIVLVPVLIVSIMYAGGMWLMSAGNTGVIKQAKDRMVYGFVGLAIAFGSFLMLSLFGLTEFSIQGIEYIEAMGLPDELEYVELQLELQQSSTGDLSEFKPKVGPKNIKTIEVETTSGNKKVQVDESIAASLQKTFKELKGIGFPIKGVGGYRSSKKCHGKGLAIDMNVTENYCIDCYNEKGARVGEYFRPAGVGSDYTDSKFSLTKEAVDILYANGWCWGGDWTSFKDYMHWSKNCSKVECGRSCQYDFSKSVKENHAKCGNTYP